jgi:hypothetical protein
MGKHNIKLVERDLKIFEIIKKVGWVKQDNIAYLLGLNYEDSKVNNIIRGIGFRLQQHGYIIKKKFLANDSNYWAFAKLGADSFDSIAEPKFSLLNVKHDNLVTRLLIQMINKNMTGIATEFELKQELISEKNKKIKIPDLIVNNTAIEIEITQKSTARIGAIIREYNYSNYDQIIYFTTTTIANIMHKMINGNSKFRFKIIDENNIIESPDFMFTQENTIHQNEKQKIRERMGLL